LIVTHFPAIRIPENEIVSTTGAGDTLVGGLVAGLVNGQGEPKVWVQKALQRVERTMRSRRAVG
jgi:pseudouridine-5'-phosphate glycosidase/pseudouridine kinase